MKKLYIAICLLVGTTPAAWADNVAHCEILLTTVVENEDGTGEAQIASYRPAVGFLTSLYDEDTDSHMTEVDDFPIRAVLCRRNDVIPAESDYNIMATGIPFILSQDFDSPDTDSLTLYWKDGAFDYVYKGHPLSEDSQAILDTRLNDFSDRGIIKQASAEDDTDDTPDVEREAIAEAAPELDLDLDNAANTPATDEIKE